MGSTRPASRRCGQAGARCHSVRIARPRSETDRAIGHVGNAQFAEWDSDPTLREKARNPGSEKDSDQGHTWL